MPLDLTKELIQRYYNELGSVEERLANSYKKTLEEVQNKISEMFINFGETPSMTELTKFNRLSSIEKDLHNKIKELDGTVKGIIGKQIKLTATGSYKTALDAIEKSGLGFDFGGAALNEAGLNRFLSDTLWRDAMSNNSAKLYTDVKREVETVLRANAREEIISGVAQGKSYLDISKALVDRFEISKTRAKTIAFTETHKAHSYGRNEGISVALTNAKELGIEAKKVWRHNAVGKPRPDHVEADGSFANEDGFFLVGGEELQAPGLGSDPSNNINCHCSAEFEVTDERYTKDLPDEEIPDKPIETTAEQETGSPQAPNESADIPESYSPATTPQYLSDMTFTEAELNSKVSRDQLNMFKSEIKNKYKLKVKFAGGYANSNVGKLKDVIKLKDNLTKMFDDMMNSSKVLEERLLTFNKQLQGSLEFIGEDAIDTVRTANGKVQGRIAGQYQRGNRSIKISSGGLKNKMYANGYVSDLAPMYGQHNIGFTQTSTIRHEFGHHIDSMLNRIKIQTDKVGRSWETVWNSFSERERMRFVSVYSNTNQREFFAESFAAITHPEYWKQNQRLPLGVENWFVDVLKIKKPY